MTYQDAAAELVGLLVAADIAATTDPAGVSPPMAFVASAGTDLELMTRDGRADWRFRVTIAAGAWDGEGVTDTLATARSAAMVAINAAPGWRLVSVSADGIRSFAGSSYLAADVIAASIIDL